MKKTKLLLKILALALAVAMVVPFITSCSGKTVMSYSADNGKTYTVNESELSFLMTYVKAQTLMELGLTKSKDTADYLWDVTYTGTDAYVEDETFDAHYTKYVLDSLKTWLVEEYLFEKYGLSYDEETLAQRKASVEDGVKQQGGIGAYKQYWGYTSSQMLEYYKAQLRADAINTYLYGENGISKVTDEDKATFFEENFAGYQFIMLDMENKVVTDENGEKVRNSTTSSSGEVTYQDSYKTEALTDTEREQKALLPKAITDMIADGEDFAELAAMYSDSYATVKYPDGVFVLKTSSLVNDTTIKTATDKLEVGESTEAITISDGKYTYIIKRIELKEKAYEDEEYADLFKSFDNNVEFDKYEKLLEPYTELVVVPENLSGKYKMSTTFTTDYVDYYYYYMQQYSQYNS